MQLVLEAPAATCSITSVDIPRPETAEEEGIVPNSVMQTTAELVRINHASQQPFQSALL